ncbi:MAG: hypothetical protein NTX25_16215 [Proteobacteria bacterium]|nr:hypothetical protein [Pseudomonadota bacterium]
MTDLKQLNEYQFVVLGFHRDEPLQRCLRGILRVKTKIHLYSHRKLLTQDSQVLAQPQAAPYFDSALL